MENRLAFDIPFSGFSGMTFLNCFATNYVFMEGMSLSRGDYSCNKRKTGVCDGCGNCKNTPEKAQEKAFMLFDLVCGHSSLRCRFDGVPTDMEKMICERDFYDCGTNETIDYLFGYAGYEYRAASDIGGFLSDIRASVDAGRPVSRS